MTGTAKENEHPECLGERLGFVIGGTWEKDGGLPGCIDGMRHRLRMGHGILEPEEEVYGKR